MAQEPVVIVFETTASGKQVRQLVKLFRSVPREKMKFSLPKSWLTLEAAWTPFRYRLRLMYAPELVAGLGADERLFGAFVSSLISRIVAGWSTEFSLNGLADKEIDFISGLYEDMDVRAKSRYRGTACSIVISAGSGLFATSFSTLLRTWRDVLLDEADPQPLSLRPVRTRIPH